MTQFTPEEIRDAAAVVRAYGSPPHVRTQAETETMFRTARMLDDIASRTEREQAEEANRQNRIEQLTDEIVTIFNVRGKWPDVASFMLDRYPALADAPARQSACDCGNENDASWCDDECASRSAGR